MGAEWNREIRSQPFSRSLTIVEPTQKWKLGWRPTDKNDKVMSEVSEKGNFLCAKIYEIMKLNFLPMFKYFPFPWYLHWENNFIIKLSIHSWYFGAGLQKKLNMNLSRNSQDLLTRRELNWTCATRVSSLPAPKFRGFDLKQTSGFPSIDPTLGRDLYIPERFPVRSDCLSSFHLHWYRRWLWNTWLYNWNEQWPTTFLFSYKI